MANVRFGGGVTEMAGSIGGTTFARGPHGAYARARVTPVNPSSAFQQAVRTLMAAAASAWHSLSDAERAAWALYAGNTPTVNKLGEQTFLSGFQWYCACNSLRRRSPDLDFVDAGPTVFGRPDVPTSLELTATADSATLSLAFEAADDWLDEDECALFIFMSQPRSSDRNYFGPPFKLAMILLGDSVTPLTSPQAGTNPWGVVTADMGQEFYGVLARADGRISSNYTGRATIA